MISGVNLLGPGSSTKQTRYLAITLCVRLLGKGKITGVGIAFSVVSCLQIIESGGGGVLSGCHGRHCRKQSWSTKYETNEYQCSHWTSPVALIKRAVYNFGSSYRISKGVLACSFLDFS
jgi:hypothetical protein